MKTIDFDHPKTTFPSAIFFILWEGYGSSSLVWRFRRRHGCLLKLFWGLKLWMKRS